MLNSSAKLESLVLIISMQILSQFKCIQSCKHLTGISTNASGSVYQANSAKWEPPHGRFRHFFYPWSEYVKVGAVLRYCAYEVMALHGVLHSEIQVCAISPIKNLSRNPIQKHFCALGFIS